MQHSINAKLTNSEMNTIYEANWQPVKPNNLPSRLTSLIGRENELADIADTLKLEDTRLLTLTGPGGTGKTRLAVQIATTLCDEFEHGAFFVPLASTLDPELLVTTISDTLGILDQNHPDSLESLLKYLQSHNLLLILDNFEHLLNTSSLISRFLSQAPGLKIIVTSREPLYLSEERQYQVPPLALPETADLKNLDQFAMVPSVRLFLDRASLVRFDFGLTEQNAAAICEICQRLDGLPLALELAAARIKTLSPQLLLSRLSNRFKLLTGGARDWPTHQQTLRSTIEWSYDLLNPTEKQLLDRLGVFNGGWNQEAAEAVCVTDNQPERPAALPQMIQSLVDKSLVRGDSAPERYGLLESIREYALERLVENGEADTIRGKHAAYFLSVAEQARPHLTGPDQLYWFKKLSREHSNFRAALNWIFSNSTSQSQNLVTAGAEEIYPVELVLRVALALWRFWQIYGYQREGSQWVRQALQAGETRLQYDPSNTSLQELQAQALNVAAVMARDQGQYEEALKLLEKSLQSLETINNRQAISNTLNTLGSVAASQGKYQEALSYHERSLAIRRELDDRRGIAVSLSNRAAIKNSLGDYEEALQLFQEALEILKPLGDQRGIALLLNNYGEVLRSLQQNEQARDMFEESLAVREAIGDKAGCAYAYISLADLACDHTEYSKAEYLYQQSLGLLQQISDFRYLAIGLEGLAAIYSRQGQLEKSTRMLGAAEALRLKLGAPLEPKEKQKFVELVTFVQGQLDAQDFADLWAEGRDLPLDETLKLISVLQAGVN